MYMTPVTIQDDTCFVTIPKVPVIAAVSRHIRDTIMHDAAEFCIPEMIIYNISVIPPKPNFPHILIGDISRSCLQNNLNCRSL